MPMATDFQNKVYRLLKKIPKGKVTTYKILADKIGTKAYRAVGSALNKNPNAPRVPCHRVVNSDGRVGGYSKGVRKKIELLRKEGIEIIDYKINNLKELIFILKKVEK